jgi:superfamily II DNA or RNA helicase
VIALRDYQIDIVEKIEQAIASGKRRILVVLPTGGGKTVACAEKIRRDAAQYLRSLFLCHRIEILGQTSQRLIEHDMPLGAHGIIQAGRAADLRPQAPVQIASIDTLHARLKRDAIDLPTADVVYFDEAHRARGRTREALLNRFPNAVWIGWTATPIRGDGRGLGGDLFQEMITGPSTPELIKLGALVPPKVYAPVYRDVAQGVKTSKGDYVIGALSKRMNTEELVGDIVTEYLAHGENRATVAFSVDVAHAVSIRDRFRNAGVPAEFVCGDTPAKEREQTLAALANGEIKVVASCMVLTEGWDCPPVSCVVLARPTKQLGLYLQMAGRGLRPHPGKADCIFLDHSGGAYKHGLPDDVIRWTLESDERATNKTAEARKREKRELGKCPECDAVLGGPPPCWSCGWQPKPRARAVDFLDGELGLVQGDRAQAHVYDPHERAQWHGMLVKVAQERGYKPGWAAHKFKEKFGAYPPWGSSPEPVMPSPEVLAWVRSRIIAYAKRNAA